MPYKDKEKEVQNKKEYYQKNKERIQERTRLYGKKWYQQNKERIQLQHREYYQQNKEKVVIYHKEWYRENKEKILRQSKDYYQKKWATIQKRHENYNQGNKEKFLHYKRKWQKYKRDTNPKYRLDENMGTAIWASLKNKKAGKRWETLVDYTIRDLMKHLEKQFDSKMLWDNYGSYWAVDHIKPKTLFRYDSPNDLEFQKCWTLENLQPLEKIENIKKGNRYE